jgi:hypothetical protein
MAAIPAHLQVAQRTSKVYDLVSARSKPDLAERLRELAHLGPFFAALAAVLVVVQHAFLRVLLTTRGGDRYLP